MGINKPFNGNKLFKAHIMWAFMVWKNMRGQTKKQKLVFLLANQESPRHLHWGGLRKAYAS